MNCRTACLDHPHGATQTMTMQTTIYALSSSPGRAGVAVIRVSGPMAGEVLRQMIGCLPEPRRASLRTLKNPRTREPVDNGIVLWFPGPASFTGEDSAEFHIHGGRAVINGVLAAVGEVQGMQSAAPGEFARRALENGKLDLTAVEGLADLIDAETEAQRVQALRQAGGALASRYEQWRRGIVSALGEIEAYLDFSDEADVVQFGSEIVPSRVLGLESEIQAHLDDGNRGEILRDGLRVAIAGPVNAGKSSLLNALARRDAAIVSDVPGTTRDVVEVRLDLNGYPVIVSDTAGIRDSEEAIEAEGIRRALARAMDAHIVVWLLDGAQQRSSPPPDPLPIDKTLVVANKADLLCVDAVLPFEADLLISAETQAGLSELVDRLATEAARRMDVGEGEALTRERHRHELEQAVAALEDFRYGPTSELELRCEDLRRAADCLGRLTGRIDVDEVLDQVFAQFCIGK